MYAECRGRDDLMQGDKSADMIYSGGSGSVASGERRLDSWRISKRGFAMLCITRFNLVTRVE